MARVNTQFRIGHNSRPIVVRHLDLWSDRNLAIGGVTDDFANVILRVKAKTARPGYAPVSEIPVHPRTEFRQLRVLLDFNPPVPVVGQVDLKAVELVGRHNINEPHYILFRNEMPGQID